MILFHDIDGCLNGQDGNSLGFRKEDLSPSHQQELAELGRVLDQSDIEHFILNTGRTWADTAYLAQAINSPKVSYALVEHGAALWEIATSTQIDLTAVVQEHKMDHLNWALDSLERVPVLVNWYETEGHVELANSLGFSGTLMNGAGPSASLTLKVPDELDGHNVLSVLEKLVQANDTFQGDRFVYHYGSEGFIDVVGQVDKGIGVEIVVEHLGGNIKKTVGIGNGTNDLPMLEKVGLSLCPANSDHEVKALCTERGFVSDRDYIDATFTWLSSRAI